MLAACDVINGFGKSTGLVQIEELGTLETPILLTNTFGVGTCANALIREAIAGNPDIGRTTATVNPVVLECNDGPLNDIQAMAVTEDHARLALGAAGEDVAQGNVGAGTGMSCFGFKGGIGTSSRQFELDGKTCHIGILALTNFGRAGDLVLPDGRRPSPKAEAQPEKVRSFSYLQPMCPWNTGSSSVSRAVAVQVWRGLVHSGDTAAATSLSAFQRQ